MNSLRSRIFTTTSMMILLWGCALICPGCRHDDGELTIMTWNVENLFDDINNGTEYSDFVPGEETWTTEDFHGKMAALSEAVRRIIRGGPDILLLQEIENENVLEIFTEDYLKGMDYNFRIMVKEEEQAAGTAVLSRLPFSELYTHTVSCQDFSTGRPVTELRIEFEDYKAVIFNNHWKSKSGGAEETEPARREAAAVINRRIAGLLAETPSLSVIVAGDLNEDIDEYKNITYAYPTALAEAGEAAILLSSGEETDGTILFSRADFRSGNDLSADADYPVLISTWNNGEDGSYMYKEKWEQIDHFLVSPSLMDGKGLELEDFSVCGKGFLTWEDGGPIRWNRERGEGYSDHLPLLLKLELK